MLPDHHDLYTFNTFLINYLYRYPLIDSRLGCTYDHVIRGIEKDLPLKKIVGSEQPQESNRTQSGRIFNKKETGNFDNF
ncbi:MAG: hypothetical protein Q8S57_03110 [Methanoregula sp.]|nr:hypothetical protein [Methanoregula sp.]